MNFQLVLIIILITFVYKINGWRGNYYRNEFSRSYQPRRVHYSYRNDFYNPYYSYGPWKMRGRSLNRYRDNSGIDCNTAEPYYRPENPMIEMTSGMLTEITDTFICVGKTGQTPFLSLCPILPDHDQYYEHPFLMEIVSIRESAAGCKILDVHVSIRPDYPNSASNNYGNCYLVLVNEALSISCPPDEISEEYKLLSLFLVEWDEAHMWHHFIPRGVGYIVCAQRNADQCKYPAKLVSGNKVLETRHVVLWQESTGTRTEYDYSLP